VFLNDKWDYNNRLSFNVAARYDKNSGVNQAHAKVRRRFARSARASVQSTMLFGNGRLRFNASYSVYSSKIPRTVTSATPTSAAGSPSHSLLDLRRPTIQGVSSPEALRQIFNWFDSVGGQNNTQFLAGGGTAGITTQIPNPLQDAFGL